LPHSPFKLSSLLEVRQQKGMCDACMAATMLALML